MKTGIDVIIKDPKDHPRCPHGPTILFSKDVNGEKRNFFACAACRDRKKCNFFLWENETHKLESIKKTWQEETKKILKINHRKLFLIYNKVKNVASEKRIYCRSCSCFVLENLNKHVDHDILQTINDYQLNHPSEILSSLSDSKKEAQYLFSKSSVTNIVKIFKSLGYKNIICVGTPRIHEYIRSNFKDMLSILLDIDSRFHSFFSPLEYCWYNSFNDHFFFKEAKDVFRDFLESNGGKDMALITDPPFGGRIEPLAYTLNTINSTYKTINNLTEDMPIFWVYPYFMEPQIHNSLPNFNMLDYKVEYENHKSFGQGSNSRKQGSPVRIFTNISPKLIKLPEEEGYKYCDKCQKWVFNENKHCDKCKACTSKDGRAYVHCDICRRCVKCTWKHCNECGRCAQTGHKCELLVFSKNCFHCKAEGHKRSECPILTDSLKRKNSLTSTNFKKDKNKKKKYR